MPCGVFESGDCVFYHSKSCHCGQLNIDNMVPNDHLFPSTMMGDPVWGGTTVVDDLEDGDVGQAGHGDVYPDIFN
jgi:hypothetical protein